LVRGSRETWRRAWFARRLALALVRAPAAAGARLLARCSWFAARGTRAAFVFSLKVAAGAGGLDAERISIAGAGSI